ncbi:hypothetical protein [Paralysiella testudinis]|uniref:Uncharacterized protein n=1 Tax=Paralysiella testudinis TaxID=2809020 RepID=A0A892ZKH7_9NEIS|nr:hypothetical protein [Paralysiella testudinis]QRQ81389.1 hypothetical protein JQU52_11825 [Paralysiella testudinis]
MRMAHPTILFAATIKGCLKAPLWQSESIFRQPFVVADVLLGFGKKQIAVNGVAHTACGWPRYSSSLPSYSAITLSSLITGGVYWWRKSCILGVPLIKNKLEFLVVS